MKLNLFQKILFAIALLIIAYAFYYNYMYTKPASVLRLFFEGKYRTFMNLLYIFFHLTFFIFFYHINKNILSKNYCCIGKLPGWIRAFFRLGVSLVLARVFFALLIFFNPYDSIFVIKALENDMPATKNSICTVVQRKYISDYHFKKHYLILDTLPNKFVPRIKINEDCYENYETGDTIKFIYFYKKGIMGYIDYLTIPEMKCPSKCKVNKD